MIRNGQNHIVAFQVETGLRVLARRCFKPLARGPWIGWSKEAGNAERASSKEVRIGCGPRNQHASVSPQLLGGVAGKRGRVGTRTAHEALDRLSYAACCMAWRCR
jgi:hypothetical protein